MTKKFDYTLIKNQAERILEQNQFTKLPIDPQMLAKKVNVLVQPKNDCREGVSGILLRQGEDYGILYATHLNNKGFENFSIAHELGHYFLEGHPEQVLNTDGIHESYAGFTSQNQFEREADTFAASLLMPEGLFKDKMKEFKRGFEGIEALANVCNTSLTATAIRYVELCDYKIAVIVSTNGIVDYCCCSNSVFDLKDIEKPKKGDKIPRGTKTELLAASPSRVSSGERLYDETDFRDWLDCKRSKEAAEEAIGLGKYGKVLTVIS
jgi:Zn-dependent peptidase ImmA (M78 family)